MGYTNASLTDLVTALSQQLADTGNVCWTKVELQRYLTEALRTWQAYTQAYRMRLTWTTTADTPFYDLTTVSPSSATALGQIVTNTDLVTDIQYALLEPATGTTWTGTDQFTLAAVTAALQRRRDQWLSETGMVVGRQVTSISPSPIGRFPLPGNTLDVRRVAWQQTDGTVLPLNREDEWMLGAYAGQRWPQRPLTPLAFSVAVTPGPSLQVVPPPLTTGALDLLLVTAGAALSASNVLMGMPDDWTWAIRLGALADLLMRDGLATDPMRSAYCQQRWADAVERAKKVTTVLQAQIDNLPVPVVSVTETDRFRRSWQGQRTSPTAVAVASQTLVAVVPVADDGPIGPYGVSVDVVARAPIPVDPVGPLQLASDGLEAVLAYAQHLATFKLGGAVFAATQSRLETFLSLAGVQDARQRAAAWFAVPLTDRVARESQFQPRLTAEVA